MYSLQNYIFIEMEYWICLGKIVFGQIKRENKFELNFPHKTHRSAALSVGFTLCLDVALETMIKIRQ